MLTVVCVLKSGGEYKPEHVSSLRDGVAAHLRRKHRFVCLSDVPVPCERIPLKHSWPKWWPKLELFRPGVFDGPVLYFDLDVLIVGSLDELTTGHRFTMCRDFYHSKFVNSSMMAWDVDLSAIYEAFIRAPGRHMQEYRVRHRWGDQGFIKDYSPIEPERWQDKFSGRVVSFKAHVEKPRHIPTGASVICFHGEPRPWSPRVRWLQERLREAA